MVNLYRISPRLQERIRKGTFCEGAELHALDETNKAFTIYH